MAPWHFRKDRGAQSRVRARVLFPHISAWPPPSPLPHLCSNVTFFSMSFTLITLLKIAILLLCFSFFVMLLSAILYLFTIFIMSFLLEDKLLENGYFHFVHQCVSNA